MIKLQKRQLIKLNLASEFAQMIGKNIEKPTNKSMEKSKSVDQLRNHNKKHSSCVKFEAERW